MEFDDDESQGITTPRSQGISPDNRYAPLPWKRKQPRKREGLPGGRPPGQPRLPRHAPASAPRGRGATEAGQGLPPRAQGNPLVTPL
eukprot:4597063-Pyramimonas_sp.AAC.1